MNILKKIIDIAIGIFVMLMPILLIAILAGGCSTPNAISLEPGAPYDIFAATYTETHKDNYIIEEYNYDTIVYTTTYTWIGIGSDCTRKQRRIANMIYKNYDSIVSINAQDTIVNTYWYEKNYNSKHAYTLKEWECNDTLVSVMYVDVRWRDSFRKWLKK